MSRTRAVCIFISSSTHFDSSSELCNGKGVQSQNFPKEFLYTVRLLHVHKWPLHTPAPKAKACYSFLASPPLSLSAAGNGPQILALGCEHFQQQLAVPNKPDVWYETAFDAICSPNINQNWENQRPQRIQWCVSFPCCQIAMRSTEHEELGMLLCLPRKRKSLCPMHKMMCVHF